MARVNLPPHTKIPKRLRNLLVNNPADYEGLEAIKYLEDRDFIQYQLYKRTGGSTDEVTEGITESITNAGVNGRIRGQIFQLQQQVEELQNNDKQMILRQLIGATNKRINDMIEDLIEAINNIGDQESFKLGRRELIGQVQDAKEELQLLNARIEEGLETTIDKRDIT